MAVPKYQYIIIYFRNGGTLRFDNIIERILPGNKNEIYFSYKTNSIIKMANFYKRNIAGWIFVPHPNDERISLKEATETVVDSIFPPE